MIFIENYNPVKVGHAYKLFQVKDGKLYPPMVPNPENSDTPVGVWIRAVPREIVGTSKTGRKRIRSKKGISLSYRPGWHLSDVPFASQFYRTNSETGEKEFPCDFVWGECLYSEDNSYQKEAMFYGITKNGKFQHSLVGLPKIPKNGYYRYRTNPRPDTVPWIIAGEMNVLRLLDDDEVAELLKKDGIKAPVRQYGKKTLTELGLFNLKGD